MTAIILTMGSAGIMCIAGVGVSSALKWFHSYELNTTKKPKEKVTEDINIGREDRIKRLKSRAR